MSTDQLSGLELLQRMMRGELAPPSMAATIPMKLTGVDNGAAVFHATAGQNHLNPMGTVHGGFAATVLDSVTGCAVLTLLKPGDRYATVDLNVKMLKPIPVDVRLQASGSVIHHSRRLGVAEGRIVDADGTVYAHATATCLISPRRTEP